jgi:hypothetical protein
MELTIEIPPDNYFMEDCYQCYQCYQCPPAPRVDKNHKHIHFDWNRNECVYDSEGIDELYKELEDFIYFLDKNFVNKYFQNSRIFVKKVLNFDIKRLYLLTKMDNSLFRSHIDLKITDDESSYYDMKWK